MTSTKLPIRSAADLSKALASPDYNVRLAVLRTIGRSPQQALAYGSHASRDIIDELIHYTAQNLPVTYQHAVLKTLAVFRDPRVVAHFKNRLSSSDRPDIIFLAASRLTIEPLASIQAFLIPLLMQDNSAAHARAAASILSGSTTLALAESIRVAILAGNDAPQPPPMRRDTEMDWLAELNGPFQREARAGLLNQKEPAFLILKNLWEQLSETNRIWLLRWGSQCWPLESIDLLKKSLASNVDPVSLEALECITRLGIGESLFQPLMARFIHHSDPALRLAALKAGASGIDWRAELAAESDSVFRAACVARLAQEDGEKAIPDLLDCLNAPDWIVRSAASDALIKIGPAATDSVKPLVHDPNQATRTGAVQILLAFGQAAWVEQALSEKFDNNHSPPDHSPCR